VALGNLVFDPISDRENIFHLWVLHPTLVGDLSIRMKDLRGLIASLSLVPQTFVKGVMLLVIQKLI
jgi:hypothetical protein